MSKDESDKEITINPKHTKVTLTTLFSAVVLTAAVVGMWWDMRGRMDTLQSEMRGHNAREWNVDDQRLYSDRLARDNPALKVPDPVDIRKKPPSGP